MSNLIERFKVCWNILTKRNYVYFGIGRDPFIWNENGDYVGIKKGNLAEYEHIENIEFNDDNSLKKVMWNGIKEYAKRKASS